MRNRIHKAVIIGLLLLAIGFTGDFARCAEKKKPQLCQGNFHSEEAAKEQLAGFAKSYSCLLYTSPSPRDRS